MSDKKKNTKIKKELIEEPLIDKSIESLKILITKGKKRGFLIRDDCEEALKNENFEDKEEFYSKVESLNIQIFDSDNEENSTEEDEKSAAILNKNKDKDKEKDEDTGRTDDPVRMYLKEMGNVELLSRIG